MNVEPIVTEQAPVSKNPLTQALKFGNLLFISGTGPADPVTGSVAEGIEAQTDQTLRNLKVIVENAGGSMGQVLKTTVFLKNMADAPAMNSIYSGYFPEPRPTRSCIEISAFGNSAWLLEIEAVAALAETP